ncbi:MAG: hypothetical protein V7784_23675 [Oceanospirillaceae bacterium]
MVINDDDYNNSKHIDMYEIIDLARNNKLRSILQIFMGMLLIAFLILMDHPQLGLSSIQLKLTMAQLNIIWFGKWFLIFSSLAYIFIAFVHLVRAIHHEREAHYVMKGSYHRSDSL